MTQAGDALPAAIPKVSTGLPMKKHMYSYHS
jgi:hypothetical protein